MTTTTCSHPHCHLAIRSTLFACREHWHGLPQRLRDEILSSWFLYLKRKITLGQLRAVQEQAIAWWLNDVGEGVTGDKGGTDDAA